MPLPLPKVVADVGPGGQLVTSMRGMNALASDIMQNKILGEQAKYAPLTVPAEAMSKLAYSQMMYPQFMAKLMGNENFLANLPDEQKKQVLNSLVNAGGNQLPANALLNQGQEMSNQQSQEHPSKSLLQSVTGKLSNIFGQASPQENTMAPQIPNNALNNIPTQNNEIGDATRAWVNSPEARNMSQQTGMMTVPPANQLLNWYRNQNTSMQQPSQQPMSMAQPTFAENVGAFEGIKSEGKKAGELRAQDINDLSNMVFSGQTKQETLDSINKIISSPEFEKIRQTPILGHNELSYYQRYGTPEQQNMVGQLVTLSGNVIRDASQDFKGAFRKGEQQLIQNMKINPGDTFDAARGKMEQLTYLNQMITERARLTGQLMQQHHISKLEAEGLADKQINGDSIRSQIHNTLNPKPTDDDIKFMMDKHKKSRDEIVKLLKEKGIL